MVFKHKGRTYSVSDVNNDGEYVVVQLKKTKESTKAMAAKIIKGESKRDVMNQVKSKPFNYFTNLPIN